MVVVIVFVVVGLFVGGGVVVVTIVGQRRLTLKFGQKWVNYLSDILFLLSLF